MSLARTVYTCEDCNAILRPRQFTGRIIRIRKQPCPKICMKSKTDLRAIEEDGTVFRWREPQLPFDQENEISD